MILVTGASGRTGGALLRQLTQRGVEARGLSRHPRGEQLVVGGDLTQPDSLEAALVDVDAVFLVWPTGDVHTAAESIARLARSARRIVYLSTIGAPSDPDAASDPITRSHASIETLVEQHAAEWTFVRSGGMASNTLGWAADIRRDGVVREAFGGIPRPLVHEDDLATVARLALTTGAHVGARLDVTGPAVVSGADQVEAIAVALGRPLRLEALTAEDAVERATTFTDVVTARSMVAAWAHMVTSPEAVSPVFEQLTGRPGTTFAQWAVDHRDDFA